jgi:hypothetical protein
MGAGTQVGNCALLAFAVASAAVSLRAITPFVDTDSEYLLGRKHPPVAAWRGCACLLPKGLVLVAWRHGHGLLDRTAQGRYGRRKDQRLGVFAKITDSTFDSARTVATARKQGLFPTAVKPGRLVRVERNAVPLAGIGSRSVLIRRS